MTCREFNLARQGYFAARELDTRQQAAWMSYILSSLTGEVCTAASLLGEDAPAHDASSLKNREREAEKKVKALMKKIRKVAK